jgi:predicted O-methyltransferase YrrM
MDNYLNMKYEDILALHQAFEAQTTPSEMVELYNAVTHTPPGAVVEIGSATGGTTIALIEAAKEVDKFVISVDPYPEDLENIAHYYTPGLMREFKEKFERNILSVGHENIIQYNEDISQCIGRIPARLSVVFIDGLHEYVNVKKEYSMLFDRLIPGGIMYIHDVQSYMGQKSSELDQGVSQVLRWGVGVVFERMLKIIKE